MNRPARQALGRAAPFAPILVLVFLLGACGGSGPLDKAETGDDARPDPAASAAEERLPARFIGTWDASVEACAGAPTDMRLRIEPDRLRFHESVARVESVQPGLEDDIQVHLAFEGEGERWREPRILRLTDEGELVIESPLTADLRVRCGGVPAAAAAGGPTPAPARWRTAAGGEGVALFLDGPGGERRLAFFCAPASGNLILNVPAFRPVGSEERMTLGSGGTVVTLVADPTGDRGRGGVTGAGPVPPELAAILRGRAGIGANYGAQDSGPHRPPPSDLAQAFLEGCRG